MAKGIGRCIWTAPRPTAKLAAKREIPYHIVDGNLTATVSDIHALVRQLKPDLVVIDGAYLLMHPNERDLYKKVAVNAALIKTQICGLAPTICSWQFARPKDGKKSVQGLDEIGSSDVVGQLSSLALGIRESESAETIKQRTLTKVYGHHAQDDLGAWCRK